jgi:hypothetical protein
VPSPLGPATIPAAMSLPSPGLVDALYREEIERARAMSPSDKLLEGPRLFARACRLMADGIRHQHPELDDAAVMVLLRVRLERLRALERT